MRATFLYHSFPRRAGADALVKGVEILRLILEKGLLLTPERIIFREQLADGADGRESWIFQKRVCFTELEPSELPEHAATFGPFSLEWDVATLRKFGTIPVFYVPLTSKLGTLDGIGASMLARLGEAQELLVRIEKMKATIRQTPNPDELMSGTTNGIVTSTTRCSVGGAADLISILEREIQPVEALTATIRAMFGYFYPTENLSHTTELGYYQQHEWRIVGNVVHMGAPVMTAPSEEDVQRLGQLDPAFFLRQMQFPTGNHTLASQSQYLKHCAGRDITASIRRIFCPENAVGSVERELRDRGLGIGVVALEAVA